MLETKIMLETWILVPYSYKHLLFCKKSAFFGKNTTFTQNSSMWAVFKFFLGSVFSFCQIKDGY